MDRITASGRPSRARNAHLPPGQNFDDIELALLLYAHGDVPPIRRISTKRDDIVPAIAETAKVLDELISGFIVESCIQMSRSAALHGRKKIKVDDIRWAYRENPEYLGKMEQLAEAKTETAAFRRMSYAEEIAKGEAEALVGGENNGDEGIDVAVAGGGALAALIKAGGRETLVNAKGVGPKRKTAPAKKDGVKKAAAPRKRTR